MPKDPSRSCAPKSARASDGSLALPVLASPKPARKKSRAGFWRTIALVLVNLAIIAHIVLWVVQGMGKGPSKTLSPVEPSEAMYTLETGVVNAGFIFFVVALALTLLLGRFVCGWTCHIIAVQDLCSWLLRKVGIHPKPFRTRLLRLAPLLLALYMFVWPTFIREVARPLYIDHVALPAAQNKWVAEQASAEMKAREWFNNTYGLGQWERQGDQAREMGKQWFLRETALDQWRDLATKLWIADPPPRPEQLAPGLLVEDFWKTFPPWWMVAPFMLFCGFAIVYVLGNKGFCTFGCPYGGFFGVLDRLAPARIKVNDDCNSCGHCTASCTSNVRVHEEVRDFGMIVDPGCMKCLDCVSVCPNNALSFALAKPAVFAKPRTPEAQDRLRVKDKNYDLTWFEEVWVGLAFLFFVWAFRNMFAEVPLLMAMAMGAIAAFSLWKLVALLRLQNVRFSHLSLKAKGRLTSSGLLFIPLALAYLALGGWSAVVRWNANRGEVLDATLIKTPAHVVFRPAYVPDPVDKANAQRALSHYLRAGPPRDGGFGWKRNVEQLSRVAWLYAVAGDLAQTEKYQRQVIDLRERLGTLPIHDLFNLGMILSLRGQTPEQIEAEYRTHLDRMTSDGELHAAYAAMEADMGRIPAALSRAEAALKMLPHDEDVVLNAAKVFLAAGRIDRAEEVLRNEAEHEPRSHRIRAMQAAAAAVRGNAPDAIRYLQEASRLAPRETQYLLQLAQAHRAQGQEAQAQSFEQRAQKIFEDRQKRWR